MAGLLDRWSKKKQKEQLNSGAQRSTAAPSAAKSASPSEPAAVGAASDALAHGIAYRVLSGPVVSEKSAVMESYNKYSFVVNARATKSEVKRAVAEVYGVTPLKVNMVNVSGKSVRFGRNLGRRSDFKKAIVTLPQGKSISIHEGV